MNLAPVEIAVLAAIVILHVGVVVLVVVVAKRFIRTAISEARQTGRSKELSCQHVGID